MMTFVIVLVVVVWAFVRWRKRRTATRLHQSDGSVRIRPKRFKFARYPGVRAYVGLPGSGKTYMLVKEAHDAYRKGIPLWVNRGLNLNQPNVKFSGWSV